MNEPKDRSEYFRDMSRQFGMGIDDDEIDQRNIEAQKVLYGFKVEKYQADSLKHRQEIQRIEGSIGAVATRSAVMVGNFLLGLPSAFVAPLKETFWDGSKAIGENIELKSYFEESTRLTDLAFATDNEQEKAMLLEGSRKLYEKALDMQENGMDYDTRVGELSNSRIAMMSLSAGLNAASLVSMAGPATGVTGQIFMSQKGATQASAQMIANNRKFQLLFETLGVSSVPGVGGAVRSSLLQAPLSGATSALSTQSFWDEDTESGERTSDLFSAIGGSAMFSLAFSGVILGLTNNNGLGWRNAKKAMDNAGVEPNARTTGAGDEMMYSPDQVESVLTQQGEVRAPLMQVGDEFNANAVLKRSVDPIMQTRTQETLSDFEMLLGYKVGGKRYAFDTQSDSYMRIKSNMIDPLIETLDTPAKAPDLPVKITNKPARFSINKKSTPIQFESDIDRALYSAQGNTKKESVSYLKDTMGWDEATIASKRKDLVNEIREELGSVVEGQTNQISPELPKELRNAKPRYHFGSKSFQLNFESDIDKALYIVGNARTKSKRHNDYMAFLESVGIGSDEAISKGSQMRETIKSMARDSEPGTLSISQTNQPTASNPSSSVEPTTISARNQYDNPVDADELALKVEHIKQEMANEGLDVRLEQVDDTPFIREVERRIDAGEAVPPEITAGALQEMEETSGFKTMAASMESQDIVIRAEVKPEYWDSDPSLTPTQKKKKSFLIDSSAGREQGDSRIKYLSETAEELGLDMSDAEIRNELYKNSHDMGAAQATRVFKALKEGELSYEDLVRVATNKPSDNIQFIDSSGRDWASQPEGSFYTDSPSFRKKLVEEVTIDESLPLDVKDDILNRITNFESSSQAGSARQAGKNLSGLARDGISNERGKLANFTDIIEDVDNFRAKHSGHTGDKQTYSDIVDAMKEAERRVGLDFDTKVQNGEVQIDPTNPRAYDDAKDLAKRESKRKALKDFVNSRQDIGDEVKKELFDRIDILNDFTTDELAGVSQSILPNKLTREQRDKLVPLYNKVKSHLDENGNIKIDFSRVTKNDPSPEGQELYKQFLQMQKDSSDLVNGLAEAKYKGINNWGKEWTKRAMLAPITSIKTPILNLMSDFEKNVLRGPLERRLLVGATRDLRPKGLPSSRDLTMRDVEVKYKTGFDLIRGSWFSANSRAYGEVFHNSALASSRTTNVGETTQRVFNAFDDIFINKALGTPDQFKASYAFYDSAGLMVTKQLKGKGLVPDTPEWNAQYRGLWSDLNNINPQTNDGMRIRKQAMHFAYDATHNTPPEWIGRSEFLADRGLATEGQSPAKIAQHARDAIDSMVYKATDGKVKIPFGTLMLRYTETSSNYLSDVLEGSGLATASQWITRGVLKAAGKYDGPIIQTRGEVVRPAIGLTTGVALGFAYDKASYYGGFLTSEMDDSREAKMLAGAKPWTVKVGDKWVETWSTMGGSSLAFNLTMAMKMSDNEPVEDISSAIDFASQIASITGAVTGEAILDMSPVLDTRDKGIAGAMKDIVMKAIDVKRDNGEELDSQETSNAILGVVDSFGRVITRTFAPAIFRDILLGTFDYTIDPRDPDTTHLAEHLFGDNAQQVLDISTWAVGGGKIDMTNVDARGVYKGRGDNPYEGLIQQVFFGHRVRNAENSPMLEEIQQLSELGHVFVPRNRVMSQRTYDIPKDKIQDEAMNYGEFLEDELEKTMRSSQYQFLKPEDRIKLLDKAQSNASKAWNNYAQQTYPRIEKK